MLKTQLLTVLLSWHTLYPTTPVNLIKKDTVETVAKGTPSTKVDIVAVNGALANAPAIRMNKHEATFADHYIKNNLECLTRIKERSKPAFYIMDSVFSLYGLPVELKYLAVIESELRATAMSRVGARGPWQLMPGTARDLGLKVSRRYDERISFGKSTRAAALYLRDLYNEFGDWLLVLAAYNGGPRPIYNAIRRSGSRNFWALQRYLPAETRGHVKRYIATHYYFEGQGSATTLTKAENAEYAVMLKAFTVARDAALSGMPAQTVETKTVTPLKAWRLFTSI